MGIGCKSYKDGVLQGFVVAPDGDHHEIRYIGPPTDLARVADFLNLQPAEGEVDLSGDTPIIELRDPRGGYATIQPVDRASDLLQTVMEFQLRMDNGEFPPFD